MSETLVVVVAVYLITDLVLDLEVRWCIEVLVPVLYLVIGGVGYSLVIGGLTLVFKRLELVNDGLFGLLFMFGGTLLPLAGTPGWNAAVARLVPVSHTAAALRRVALDGRPLAVTGDGGLLELTATTAAWLVAGVVAFHLGEGIAKRRGSLSRY